MGQVLGTNIQNGCYLFLLYSYGELHMRKVLLNILTMGRKVLKNVLLSHIFQFEAAPNSGKNSLSPPPPTSPTTPLPLLMTGP